VQDGRTDDLVHDGVHLIPGALGVALPLSGVAVGARLFALRFGSLGWFWSNRLGVLPLGPADHAFHLVIGSLTLRIGLWATSMVPTARLDVSHGAHR
jgi:hypothetical protein